MAKPKWWANICPRGSSTRPSSSTGTEATKIISSSLELICRFENSKKPKKQINSTADTQPPKASMARTYQGEGCSPSVARASTSGCCCGTSPTFCRCAHSVCQLAPATVRPKIEGANDKASPSRRGAVAILTCRCSRIFASPAVMPVTSSPHNNREAVVPVSRNSPASAKPESSTAAPAASRDASIKRSGCRVRYHHHERPANTTAKPTT